MLNESKIVWMKYTSSKEMEQFGPLEQIQRRRSWLTYFYKIVDKI